MKVLVMKAKPGPALCLLFRRDFVETYLLISVRSSLCVGDVGNQAKLSLLPSLGSFLASSEGTSLPSFTFLLQ